MSELSRRSFRVSLAVLAIAAALPGCGSFDRASNKIAGVITPYKIDIVQGNVVTREQLAVLKPGMSRIQVRDVLGTALLSSVFHADRWEYVFTLKQQGVPPQARKVTVFFKNDAMEKVEADELPTEAEFVATLKSKAPYSTKPVLEATPEELNKFPVAPKPTQAPSSVVVPANYPPLESASK